LKLEPTPSQEKVLKGCEEESFKFLSLSREKLKQLLYHELKDEVKLSRRTLALLIQRFTGSMGGKTIIPFDEDNSKFVKEDGFWFVEIQPFKGRGRIKIPVARTEVPYYSVIQELQGYPFYITRENVDWFAYISIPAPNNSNGTVIGIDFNLKKWVATPYQGKPQFFDAEKYEGEIDRLQKLIARYQSRGESEKVKECHEKIQEQVKLAHGNFLKLIRDTWDVCNLAIEDVEVMFKLREKDSQVINNWLYRKAALRQFALRAMAKGFNIIEVNPEGTSKICHRCGSPVKIYGKHKRLITCEKCGYKDYNRDLNAARNIAKKGLHHLTLHL